MNSYKRTVDVIDDKYFKDLDKIHSYLKKKYIFGYDIVDIYMLWVRYSNDNGAGFLIVSEETMNEFVRWLKL